MKKRLIIVGAGGFGREVLAWCEHIPDNQRDWSPGGFLDDDDTALAGLSCPLGIVGSVEDYRPRRDDVLVIGIFEPRIKLGIAERLKSRGAEFTSVIHPTSVLASGAEIGAGAVLCPFSLVSCGAKLDDFVAVNVSSSIGHDSEVGEGASLSSHVDLTGRTSIGRGVFLGSHASVLPGVRVGDFARVGAGAVVVKNVKARTTVFGNPARAIWPADQADRVEPVPIRQPGAGRE